MRWRCAVLAAIVCAALLAPRTRAEGKKYALLIGVNYYTSTAIGTLEYADDDVDELAKELRNHGFNPIYPYTATEANRTNVVAALYKFSAEIRPEDTFLLYFAGHGMRSTLGTKPTYWLTHKAAVEQLDVEGIRLSHLLDYVADIPARKKLIVLDHCFSADVIARGDTDTAGRAREGPTQIIAQPLDMTRGGIPIDRFDETVRNSGGTLVIAAARGFAYELPELQHGVLTAALLEAFQSRKADLSRVDGELSAAELSTHLKKRVKELSKSTQEAQVWTANGVNLEDWIIADKLPLDTATAVSAAVIHYKDLFAKWHAQGLLTAAFYTDGLRMLDAWRASASGGRTLTTGEAAAIERLRAVTENSVIRDEDNAPVIRYIIDRFLGRTEDGR